MRKVYELIQPVTTHNGRMVFFQLPYTKGYLFNQAICFYYNGLFQNGKRYLKSCNWFNVEICSSYKNEPKPFFQLREVEKKKKKKQSCNAFWWWIEINCIQRLSPNQQHLRFCVFLFFLMPHFLGYLTNMIEPTWTPIRVTEIFQFKRKGKKSSIDRKNSTKNRIKNRRKKQKPKQPRWHHRIQASSY